MIRFKKSVILSGGEMDISSTRNVWPSRSRRTLVAPATILDGGLKPLIGGSPAAGLHELPAAIHEHCLFRKAWNNFLEGKVLRLRLGILNWRKKKPGSPSLRMTERGNCTAAGTAAATTETSS